MEQTLQIIIHPSGKAQHLVVPKGVSTPHGTSRDFESSLPFQDIIVTPTNQHLAVMEPAPDETVTLTYTACDRTAPFDDSIWAEWGSRYTTLDPIACTEAKTCAATAADPTQAIVDHVTELFTYGHVDKTFYEDHDVLPQLCQMTTGSCVDINAYLIASLRAAGIKAGYITGYFFPAEKAGSTTDMHCWVVTEDAHGLRYWDIAHYLKMGRRDVGPALNPKPGCRVPIAFAMGHDIPAFGIQDIKLIAEPIFFDGTAYTRPEMEITLSPWQIDRILDVPQAG